MANTDIIEDKHWYETPKLRSLKKKATTCLAQDSVSHQFTLGSAGVPQVPTASCVCVCVLGKWFCWDPSHVLGLGWDSGATHLVRIVSVLQQTRSGCSYGRDGSSKETVSAYRFLEA